MTLPLDPDACDSLATWRTEYREGGARYGFQIEAVNETEARAILLKRGIGESLMSSGVVGGQPEFRLPELISSGKFVAAMHEACALGWIALESGASNARELLGDDGLIHQLAHLADNTYAENGMEDESYNAEQRSDHALAVIRCMDLAKDLMWRVPGWPGRLYEAHARRDAKEALLLRRARAAAESYLSGCPVQ